jgi:hypothetical protein
MNKYEISNVKNSFETHAKQENSWIGLSDMKIEGTFLWEYTKSAVVVTDWKDWQPDNKGNIEDCVEIRIDWKKKWNDIACSNLRPGLCQFRSVKGYFTFDEQMNFDEASMVNI